MAPRDLLKHLDLDSGRSDLREEYNSNQPRVPAGHGRDSGRWAPVLHTITDWLNEPVPEYDQDTGEEVGTRTRGRAITADPFTITAASAAAIAGGEALLAGEAATLIGETAAVGGGEVAAPEVVDDITIATLRARGLASEARVLDDLSLHGSRTPTTKSPVYTKGHQLGRILDRSRHPKISARLVLDDPDFRRFGRSASDTSSRTFAPRYRDDRNRAGSAHFPFYDDSEDWRTSTTVDKPTAAPPGVFDIETIRDRAVAARTVMELHEVTRDWL